MLPSIYYKNQGALIVYNGLVRFQDFMAGVLATHVDPNYATLKYAMHDMSNADNLDLTGIDIIQLVAQEIGARYTNPDIKLSIVTSRTEIQALAKTFAALTQQTVDVLPNQEAAQQWCAAHGTVMA